MKNNQHNYEKVKTEIINPIQELYGSTFNEYAIDAMVEDLARYSKETLHKAMKTLRQTRKRAPNIADIIEACREAGGKVFVSPTTEKKDFTQEANKFLNTADGQMCLQEGFGFSAWEYVRSTGDHELKNKSISSLRDDKFKSEECALDVERSPVRYFYRPMLLSIWEKMQEKERDFTRQYLNRPSAQVAHS